MKQLFKTCCLLFITASGVYGQEVEIINKTFEANDSTVVNLDLKNVYVNIEASPDNKVHISSKMLFNKYTKRQKEKILERVKVDAVSKNNNIKINGEGNVWSTYSSFWSRSILFGRALKTDTVNVKKSKTEILEQINIDGYGSKKGNTPTADAFVLTPKSKRYKHTRSLFVIKIPTNVSINIRGKNCTTRFKDITNPIKLNIERGGLMAGSLKNTNNKIYLKDGYFKVGKLNGGEYGLNDVNKGLIGEIENVNIKSNFSKLEIGEIGKNVSVTDFNSEFWFYNFSDNLFKKFYQNSDYSKIHFYDDLKVSFQSDDKGPLILNTNEVKITKDNSVYSIKGYFKGIMEGGEIKYANTILYYHD